MAAGTVTRVVVVDDQALVRQGIITLLEVAGITVVGQADDGAEAIEIIEATDPDVVLLDLRMPRHDGIWTLERLREAGRPTPVLVLTTFDDSTLVLDSLRLGARGYLLKDVTVEQLTEAVTTLARGDSMIAPSITDRLMNAAALVPETIGHDQPSDPDLTTRETEVLRLMAAGYSNQEIATALFITTGTARNHVSAVLMKFGARDRTNAVIRALQDGYLR